jgi:phage repressor protein C with HTH and peptisase S24 domain
MARNLTHSNLWRGIDMLAARHGMSVSALARRAGLDPTAFNKSKRTSPDGKPHWPSTETIAKILAATGESLANFVLLLSAPRRPRRPPLRTRTRSRRPSELHRPRA